MIKATVIFGNDATRKYDETGKVPSGSWLKHNDGCVDQKEFRTSAEYNVYVQALSDGSGWEAYDVIKQEETTEACSFCQKWREFFKDKITTVYCPDCGQQILNP